MRRRTSSVAAVTVTVALALAGCSSGGDNGQPAPAIPSMSNQSGPSGQVPPPAPGAASAAPTTPVTPLPPAGGDPVKWADNLCTPLSEFTKSVAEQAANLSQATSGDQAQLQIKLSQLVDSMATGLGHTVDRLKTLEPSPIKGADDVKNKIVESYQKSQGVFRDAAAKMRAGDQDAANQVMQSLGDETGRITDPFKDNNTDALRDAMGKAATCKDITGG